MLNLLSRFLCKIKDVCYLLFLLRNSWPDLKPLRFAHVGNSKAADQVGICLPGEGRGLEFADYRRYTPGDDLRYIDWKLYCRTDRHYIKIFQEEEDLYTYLFLDLSASMGYPVSDDKYGATRDIALALAYIVLAGDDAVKLHALTHNTSDTG